MYLFSVILLAFIAHEGGHYLAARCFGRTLKFRFEWGWLFGKFPVPRCVWTMPQMEAWKQKVVALAGFGAEILCVPVVVALHADFGISYMGVVALHLIAYRFYAGSASDFKWL